MKTKILSLIGILLLSGCATKPSEIAPAYVSTSGYRAMSCLALEKEAEIISRRAIVASGAQEKAANNDAAMTTVAVILFWPAIFFNKGDGASAAEVARLKGKMQAIEDVSRQKNCAIVFQRD